jgi:hypothetical protein
MVQMSRFATSDDQRGLLASFEQVIKAPPTCGCGEGSNEGSKQKAIVEAELLLGAGDPAPGIMRCAERPCHWARVAKQVECTVLQYAQHFRK